MIRLLCLLIAMLSFLSTFAQLQDNFSDGDLTTNPSWEGDVDSFIVNPAFELQLQATSAGSSDLYIPSQIPDSTLWDIYLRLEFAPSTSNQLRIYLQADQTDLNAANGYYLQIGESGSGDAIRFFRQDAGSATELGSGAIGAVGGTEAIARIQVLRSQAGSWTLFADYSGESNFQTEVSFDDDTYGGGNLFFGFQCAYSDSRKDKFFFDDIGIAPLLPDTEAPLLISVVPLSATDLDVLFNEALDPISAADPSNYLIDGGIGQPMTAVLDQSIPGLVHLSLSSALVSQQAYSLEVAEVEDLAGNPGSLQTAAFTYFLTEEAAPFDVLINEIMADPTPVVDLPDAEFIELYNRSDKIIDLASLTFFKEGNTPVPLPSFLLLPDQYVIVCDDAQEAALMDFGDVASLSSFPSLTNTGDHLFISSLGGTTIHSVNYSKDWYRDPDRAEGGWTLELINPALYCQEGANWRASAAAEGGTPGQQNANFDDQPDLDPPNLLSARPVGDTQLRVFFDEIMSEAASDASLYQLSPEAGFILEAVLEESGRNTVLLSLEAPAFTDATTYTLQVDANLSDCSGNPLGAQSTAFTFFATRIANRYDIVINEIMADPTLDGGGTLGFPAKEYIELYNRSDQVFNLENFTLLDLSEEIQLPYYLFFPDTYVTLYKTVSEGFSAYGDTLPLEKFLGLGNEEDGLGLFSPEDELIHSVFYQDSWYRNSSKKSGGWSLEMINPDRPCEAANNWRATVNANGGTPGQQNSIFDPTPDVQGPELLRAFPDSPSSIRLFFSEALNDSIAEKLDIYEIEGFEVVDALLEAPLYRTVVLNFSSPMERGKVYEVSVKSELSDCLGNRVGVFNTTRFGLPQQIEAGAIVLNEILFNPATGGVRFVELYNVSDSIINLADLTLAGRDEFGDIAQASPVASDFLIFPGDYVVITSDPLDILDRYVVEQPRNLLSSAVPTYGDREGTVVLYLPTVTEPLIIDEFFYESSFHYDLLDDQNGVSLERIDPNEVTQLAANWHSAAQSVGFATPTYQNSQFYANTNSQENLIELPRNRFSPDEDGFEDFLLINYNPEVPGFTANVQIFDARGRLVKTLTSNELLSPSGSLKWDGSTDEGTKARIGIYVVWVELFNPQGTVQHFKKSCVLAGHL